VRFIAESISDEVFKALCTIKGGESSIVIGRDAPKVEPPAEGEEPQPLPAPTPPVRPKVEVPEPPPSKVEAPESKPNSGADIALVLANNCAMCHTGPRAKGKIQIFTSPGVLNASAPRAKMWEALSSGKMPPENRPRLKAEDLNAIHDWTQDTP
jgi:mono/diheme cytochrome c family protein